MRDELNSCITAEADCVFAPALVSGTWGSPAKNKQTRRDMSYEWHQIHFSPLKFLPAVDSPKTGERAPGR